MSNKQVGDFSQKMIEGCEAALDAGIFYQDPFEDFVTKHMGGLDSAPVLVDTVEIDMDWEDYLARQKAILKPLAEKVATSPRGHYAIVCRIGRDRVCRYGTMVSDGRTEDGRPTLATGGKYNSYDTMPTGEDVVQRMMGYEIYECRDAVEKKRLMESDIAAFEAHGFRVGMEFKSYRHPSEIKPYSKAIIQEVFPETGRMKLYLVKRGSPKRWETYVGAAGFSVRVGLQQEAPSNRPPFIVVKKVGEDLFA